MSESDSKQELEDLFREFCIPPPEEPYKPPLKE